MSATGYTPIQLYRTTTAAATPSAGNLAAGELAINTTDEKLYFKNTAGVVKLLAASSGAEGTVTSVAASGGTTGLTFSGSPITTSGTLTLGGTLGVANGGTGASTFTSNGVLIGNGTSAISATAAGTTGQVLVGNTGGAPSWATLSGIGVTSFSAGTTGLTPSTGTTGAITLAGTLGVANGGTGATSLTSGYLVKGNGTSAVSTSVVYDDGTNVGIGTSSPSGYRLRVYGSNDNSLLIDNDTSQYTSAWFANNGTNKAYISYNNSSSDFTVGNITASGSLLFVTNSTEKMRIDSSGNLGLGVTPSAWNTGQTFKAIDLNAYGALYSYTNGQYTGITNNAYFGSGGWTYKNTAAASKFDANLGSFQWSIAPSGTAGNAITFTQAMTLDASGKLQLNTTSTAGGYFTLNTLAQAGLDIYRSDTSANYNGIRFRDQTNAATYGSMGWDSGGLRLNGDAGTMYFSTSGTERARIDSSGNLLVGTTSAGGARLNVSGAGGIVVTDANGHIWTTANSTAADATFNIRAAQTKNAAITFTETLVADRWSVGVKGGNGSLIFATGENLTVGTERMRIDSSGNVGIGAAPLSFTPLYLYRSGADAGLRAERASGAALDMFATASTAYFGTATNHPLLFQTNGSEKARIGTNGAFLIGTTGGNVGYGGGSGFIVEASGQTHNAVSGSTDCYYMQKDNTGGAFLKFFYGALNSTPATVGDVTTNGTGTSYNTASDYRLKDINGPIQNSGAYIDALKPVQGSWKADGSRFIGLIAHEVQEVSETQIATGVKDGETMQAMDYSAPELIANLIAEIQSLRARVAQLEGN